MNGGTPDPHLGKALAHAPDRDVAPPPHLSAQILAAAHREAAVPSVRTPRPPAPWWRRPWGSSGALATVLLAGFVGLLWRGEPPGPAVDGPAPAPAQMAEAPAPAATPVTGPAVAESRSEISRKADTPVLAQATRQRAEAALSKAAQAKEAARAADMQVAHAAPQAEPAGKVTADNAAVARAPVSTEPAPASPPAPMFVPPPAAPPPAPPPMPAPAMAPARAAVAAALPAQRTPMAEAMVSRPTPAGLPLLLPGDQLAWQPPSTAAVPDAAWLQQLAALTRGRWLPAEGMQSAGAAAAAAPQLSWQRSGAPLGVLRLDSGVVWWCTAGQTCLRALVPPDALRDLVGKLPGER